MFGWLSVGKEVGDAAGGVIGAIFDGIDKLTTSDEEKAAAKLALAKLMQQPQEWQAIQNRLEAQHRTIFVAGWRPFIGWIGGCALAYHFILHPVGGWLLVIFAPDTPAPPTLDSGPLITVVLSMLGLAGFRSYEKGKGVAK